jgi:hypothetical protein
MVEYEIPEEDDHEDVDVVMLGVEGQTPDNISPEDTWSPLDDSPLDGNHVYEVTEYSEFSQPAIRKVRPIVTRQYVERMNSSLQSQGREPLMVSRADADKSSDKFSRQTQKDRAKKLAPSRALKRLISTIISIS